MSVIILYIFVNIYFILPCISVNMLGPADMIFKSFEHCETKITDVDIWLTQKKFNRTTNVLDITLISPWTIDDNLILELTSEVKKEGGYKPGQFHMKDSVCKVLSTIMSGVFNEFLKLAGTDNCPLPNGKYEVFNFYLDNEKNTVPLLYGEYRTRMEFYKDEELKGCYFMFHDILPKQQ